jgi:hypothetical protein
VSPALQPFSGTPDYEKERQVTMNTHRRKHLQRSRAKKRPLLVPVERDRELVRQLAQELTQSIEPLLSDNCHGFRPGRNCDSARTHVASLDGPITAFDVKSFFPSIDHQHLRRQLNRIDPDWWYRLWPWIPRKGLAMGVAFSPVLSNLYLNGIDERFPHAVRYVDNIIVSEDPRPLMRQLQDLGLAVHEIERSPTRWLGQSL